METQVKEKMVINPEEFINEFGFSRSMVYENLLKRKDFPCFKIGKKYFINRNKLAEWFDKQCQ
ncbi:helix-turn-helix domain-containing protein [Clostridium botulinum]|uniref:helix-turn-helix domain-containing protein n=1 Tax=Clostridium botulinum TaxID=1491 RepID=UPI000774E196|nr:helix-turn-helix domain-containing protein [Clostridium botulinum]MBY6931280.1 helix-turn-helix domain-containing protein [Clostridium botulinum]NFG19801.1 helix-turn-helix domain-containing protein [Clostridium botulinum]NFO79877.1 helix-turn-helix domain-containing protein [Clostridium botulinum]